MHIRFDGDRSLTLDTPLLVIDEHFWSTEKKDPSLTYHDDYLLIASGDHTILYDRWLQRESLLPSDQPIAVYLADISEWYDHHLELLQTIGGSQYVIPFPTVDQQSAIDFCRTVMMQQLGIPKYFVPGQSFDLLA